MFLLPKRYPFPLRPIDESTLAKPRPTVPGASAYLHNPSQLARFLSAPATLRQKACVQNRTDSNLDDNEHSRNRLLLRRRGKRREWRPRMPGDPKECRQHAKRCAELAQIARTQEDRDKFSALQMNWLSLALELDHMGALIKAMQELEAEDQSIKAAE